MTSDCIVVGGGLVGMLTARELALNGLQVRLFERGILGSECSWAGGGILSPLYPWHESCVLRELIHWSQKCYPDLAGELYAETGIDPEWQQSGMLVLESNEQDKAMEWAKKNHVPIEIITSDQLPRLEPGITGCPTSALFLPEITQVRTPRLIAALRLSLQKLGVVISEHSEITEVEIVRQKVHAVKTLQQTFHAEVVVIACGAWSNQLLERLGQQIIIRPVRGQMICYQAIPGYLQHILLNNGIYLIPRKDGHILAGSTVEDVGYDKDTTVEARYMLTSAVQAMLPGINDYPLLHHWAGLRPGTPDGIPYICAYPGLEGLYLNTGHYRSGIMLAPASARLLTDIILTRQTVFSWQDFQLQADIRTLAR